MNKGIKNHAFMLLKNIVAVTATSFTILAQISTLTIESKIRHGSMGHGLLIARAIGPLFRTQDVLTVEYM